MRTLVIIALVVNLLLLAYGQSFFGIAPHDLGRSHSPKPFFNHAQIHVDTLAP